MAWQTQTVEEEIPLLDWEEQDDELAAMQMGDLEDMNVRAIRNLGFSGQSAAKIIRWIREQKQLQQQQQKQQPENKVVPTLTLTQRLALVHSNTKTMDEDALNQQLRKLEAQREIVDLHLNQAHANVQHLWEQWKLAKKEMPNDKDSIGYARAELTSARQTRLKARSAMITINKRITDCYNSLIAAANTTQAMLDIARSVPSVPRLH